MRLNHLQRLSFKDFASGFYKGLGAPCGLFHTVEAQKLPSIPTVHPVAPASTKQAFAQTAKAIGTDIRKAMKAYDQEESPSI